MANNTTVSAVIVFRHQSQNIPFSNWIPLLTVCLAPLIAHLIAGAPKIVYLHCTIPPWHEIIVHYNPTSIIWRYYAIIDRRVRARSWNNVDMAAGNALFWTSHGWDGSEAMLIKSRDICIREPPPLRKRLLSTDALKTVIVTLQGIQAVYLIVDFNSGFTGFALDSVFMPLAFIGLLRLPSALWLTEEYLFVDQESFEASSIVQQSPSITYGGDSKEIRPSANPLLELLTLSRSSETAQPGLFRGAMSPRSLFVRACYAAFMLGFLVLDIYRSIPRRNGDGPTPLTPFIASWAYALLLLVSSVTILFYWFRDRSLTPSTVIPCVSTIWYKIYTGLLIAIFVMLIIVASLETRRLPCGSYTTSTEAFDRYFCPNVQSTNTTASS